MDIQNVEFVGSPCGQHGPYTFYKAFRFQKNGENRILSLSEFFFVKMYRDSDLLCIGELQLLWFDKNSENMLASLRLYFLPENTPDGRMTEHGEDEVLAISEKVVIRVDDLVTWVTIEGADWSFGRLAKCEDEVFAHPSVGYSYKHQEKLTLQTISQDELVPPKKSIGYCFGLTPTLLDFGDVEIERQKIENAINTSSGPHVIILSFPKYCRYRAVMKRLEGVENQYLKLKIVNTLGGFYVKYPNTRVLFCKDNFEYPDIEGHELLCNHLAPKLKGRPRGRRKKTRSLSPGSESNESESSANNVGLNHRPVRVLEKQTDRLSDSVKGTRRSTRTIENNENKKFMKTLTAYMKSKQMPMGRVPSLGYKELNLHEFFSKVQKLGGYDSVTKNRLWKSIFEEITGLGNSTSAATIVRRHYERFLLSYERFTKGEDHRPLPVSERKRLKKELKRKKEKSAAINKKANNGRNDNGENETPGGIKTLLSIKKQHALPVGNENKDQNNPTKPTSLRHIRVKPERQKDKQLMRQLSNSDLDKEKDNMLNMSDVKSETSCVLSLEDNTQNSNSEVIIKSVENESLNPNPKVEDVKPESPKINEERQVQTSIETVLENAQLDSMVVIAGSPKSDPVAQKLESLDAEPITSAVAPVVQISIPDKSASPATIPEKSSSPVEGKENIPLVKEDEASLPENERQIQEVNNDSSKSNSPELQIPQVDSSLVKLENKDFHKKVKLDILRDQGLEVTPIKGLAGVSIVKDIRPSVIQTSVAKSLMPPPGLPKKINVSITPATPIRPSVPNIAKSPSPVKDFKFMNGGTPPKVVQSKSIYSTDKQTWYGNPKDIFAQPAMVPRFPTPVASRLSGGNPMAIDLSVTSPVKPVLEISPVPQSSNSNQSMPISGRISVAKNLYKNDTSSILGGKRLGSNLEITLVGPKNSQLIKPVNSTSQKRSSSETYAHKISKLRMNDHKIPLQDKYSVPLPRRTDLSITGGPSTSSESRNSSNYRSGSSDVRLNYSSKNSSSSSKLSSSGSKSMVPSIPSFPESSSSNGALAGLPSGLPMIPPNLGLDIYAYQAAMQSLYNSLPNMSNLPNLPPPVLPIPAPEQLKFYAELMAGNRLGFNPFLSQNGVNNGGKNS